MQKSREVLKGRDSSLILRKRKNWRGREQEEDLPGGGNHMIRGTELGAHTAARGTASTSMWLEEKRNRGKA